MEYNCTEIKKGLPQIADTLLLNGTLIESPGLVNGKMGVAIFFFHYAQYSKNMLFADYAVDLIEEMQNQIHVSSPADYEKGIAGIGVGIDYLIRKNFLAAEDDICEDFDQRMFRAVMYEPWQDFSLYDGLTGYGRYWISRFSYQPSSRRAQECLLHILGLIEEKLPTISIEEQIDVACFLRDLQKISGLDCCTRLLKQCQKLDINKCFPRLGDSVIGCIIHRYQISRYCNETLQGEIDIALKQIPDLEQSPPPSSMGLLTGYAGEGLLRLTVLDSTHMSWMSLL